MKNSKLFQYVVIGAFVFFIIIGVILFSTYKSKNKEGSAQINISMWGTLPLDSFGAFTDNYFENAGLKYTVNYKQVDPASFDRELIEALASGGGPDAIILPTDLIVRYSNKIYTIPYVSLPEINFKQTFIQEGEFYLNKDGVLALPFSVDPIVMYWNRDIFSNAGLTKAPTTWTEISNLVPKMTRQDQNKNILNSTVALGEARNVVNAKEILSALIIQSGSPIVGLGSDGSLTSVLNNNFGFNTSPAVLSLEYFTNFSNPNRKEYSWNRSLTNSQQAFANGDLAMYFGFASEFMTIKNKNPNLNFEVAILPQITGSRVYSTYGNMLGFAIMKNSKDPAGTFSVITALTSAGAVPYWTNLFNLPSARKDSLGDVSNSASKTIFNRSAIISKGWLDPNRAETNLIFQEMIESYTTGRESISGAVSTASDRLDSLLK